MNLHTDQATLDRWRTDGRWEMFGEGDRVLNPTPAGVRQRREDIEPSPPAWMVEAAKPCKTCAGYGVVMQGCFNQTPCPDCDEGRQRHTITVPCERCRIVDKRVCPIPGCSGRSGRSLLTDGRITVPELAVVEWGPTLIDERLIAAGDSLYVVSGDPDNNGLTEVPPDIDPRSLVGQHGIGGKLVTP